MKKAIFIRFMLVLMIALCISGVVIFWAVSNQLLDNNIANLRYTIRSLDYSLDYGKDLQTQVIELKNHAWDGKCRITIIGLDGEVVADSDALEEAKLENHSNREEFIEAKESGTGSAIRFSHTVKAPLLYVAVLSQNHDYILRLSIHYAGITEYLIVLVPILLLAIAVSLIFSAYMANRFTNSITNPLNEIAEEMKKVDEKEPEFAFKHYQYDELNIISNTTVQLSKKIKKYLDKLEFEKQVRQEFFSNASHELKTPITSVRGYAELLENDFIKDPEKKKDFIKRILIETDNMTNLIEDILTISRLETKEVEETFSYVRLVPLLQDILDTYRPIAEENHVHIKTECEPLTIYASHKQMQELVGNLIGNAIKYNQPEGKVNIMISQIDKEIKISVSDTGMGISKEDQKRIFQRFYRVEKGRSKKMGGTGLGLSIVKHIVEYYGGRIEVQSEEGVGSTFTIFLPAVYKEEAF